MKRAKKPAYADRDRQPSIMAPVITDATAPALLGMSARQFREAVSRQRLPFIKLGQRTVVLVADLQRLAHANAPASEAHPEPRDHHNRRLAARTEADDLMDRIEHMDRRDAVNAILATVGRQLTDEAYAAYGAGESSGPSKGTDPRAPVVHEVPSIEQSRLPAEPRRREERTRGGQPPAERPSPPALDAVRPVSTSSAPRDKAREVAILHPAWQGFLDFLVETAIKRSMDEQAEKMRRGEPIEAPPAKSKRERKVRPSREEPELLTVEEAVARLGVSREQILAEFDKHRVAFEVTIPPGPRARRRARAAPAVEPARGPGGPAISARDSGATPKHRPPSGPSPRRT